MPDHSINAGDIQGRVPRPLLERLEDWRRAQPIIPSRAEALRLLIERALADDTAPKGEVTAS